MYEKKKILIVDDQALCRTVLTITLREKGYIVDEACNGLEALLAIKANQYDLVVMDYHMPEMNGIECTKAIRLLEIGKEYRLSIIGQTSSSEIDIAEKCLESGMDAYLNKDCTTEQFHAAVAKWTTAAGV